jgi:chitinase
MALTANNRTIFANSCLKLIKFFDLDGVDIDWEFPGYPGEGGNIYRPVDKQNYTLLFKTLRETLGEHYVITAAADGWATHFLPHTEMAEVARYADYICLMTYNFNNDRLAGGHYLNTPAGWDPAGSVEGAVKDFLGAGVPRSKLVIGAGFFPAALHMQTADPHDRRYAGKLSFRGGLAKVNALINKRGFRRYWDSVGQAPYLFNPRAP